MVAAKRQQGVPQVGAPDPELNTSPIVDESQYDEEAGGRDLETEEGACYFNSEPYPIGSYVQSGSELLQCTSTGVWARKAEREGPGEL